MLITIRAGKKHLHFPDIGRSNQPLLSFLTKLFNRPLTPSAKRLCIPERFHDRDLMLLR